MVQNQIKEDRMKSYFIESAKQIIKSEGIRALSVRSVSKKAGYSFATLYNYFENLRDLVFFCIKDFLVEAKEFIVSEKHTSKSGIMRIQSLSTAYCKYFVQYPDIFSLLYSEQMADVNTVNICELTDEFYESIFKDDWDYCFVNKVINKAKINDLMMVHRFLLNGILLNYLNRGEKFDYSNFIQRVEKSVKIILN
ncbi:MAG: TetR/AcrR family transcriptional regulator [bacterium]